MQKSGIKYFIILSACMLFIACKTEAKKGIKQEEKPLLNQAKDISSQPFLKDTTLKIFKDIPTTDNEKSKVLEKKAELEGSTNNSGPKTNTNKVEKENSIPEKSIELPVFSKDKVESIPKEEKTVSNDQIGSRSVQDGDPVVTVPQKPITKQAEIDKVEDPPQKPKEEITEEKIVEEIEINLGADHSKFDALLQKYVGANGSVNYRALLKEKDKLIAYTSELRNFYPDNTASRGARLAYFINAYNAFTLLLILDNYPLKSIMDLDGGKPWDRVWIKLGTQELSLNQIEHEILRKELKEPRVHFAVNCAAKSCPPLHNKAFTARNVENLLEQRTRAFINDENQNSVAGTSIELSKIFEWYKEDFGNLIDYMNRYRSTKLPHNTTISYKEYDWKLNE